MFEVGTHPGHPSGTDLVAYSGIGLGLALLAFVGHPSGDLVAYPSAYVNPFTVAAPGFPTQFFGLKGYDGGALDLCLVAVGDAPSGMGGVPMLRKNGVTYAVYLVETSDPNASTFRFRTSAGTKAVRLKT